MKRSTCHGYYVLRTSELGIFVFYGQRRKACAYCFVISLLFEYLRASKYFITEHYILTKKKTIFPHYCDCPHWQQWSPLDWAEADHNTVLQSG